MNAQDFFWISLSVAVWIGTGTILCLLFRWRREDREIQRRCCEKYGAGWGVHKMHMIFRRAQGRSGPANCTKPNREKV